MTHRLLVDTSIFAYALGGEHPAREPCREFLASAAREGVELHASVEMIQELVVHRMRRVGRETAVEQARMAADGVVLHPFDEQTLGRALTLIATSSIGGRDAVHVATAQLAGITTIVSPDSDYDAVIGRLDPTHDLADGIELR